MNLDLACLQSIRTLADDIRRLADALRLEGHRWREGANDHHQQQPRRPTMNLDLACLQSIRTLADDIRRLADALMLRSSAMPEQRIAELMAVLDPAPHALREVRDDLAALAQEPQEPEEQETRP